MIFVTSFRPAEKTALNTLHFVITTNPQKTGRGDAGDCSAMSDMARSGVTRKDANCMVSSSPSFREGGNPWDLPKSWTKGTGLLKQQDLIKITEKQCIACVVANKRNRTLYIEKGLKIDGKRKSTVA